MAEKLVENVKDEALEALDGLRNNAKESFEEFKNTTKEQMNEVIADLTRQLDLLSKDGRVYKEQVVKLCTEANEKVQLIQKELEIFLAEALKDVKSQANLLIGAVADKLGSRTGKQLKKELKDATDVLERLVKEINKTVHQFAKDALKEIHDLCKQIPESQ